MKRTLMCLELCLMICLAGCSDGGSLADLTLINDGFKGITYTSFDDPTPVGPVDETDWRNDGSWYMFYPVVPCGGAAALSRQTAADTSVSSGVPVAFATFPAYPNPFNPTTSIEFSLPVACHVYASIINDRYETVQVLFCQQLDEGLHLVHWSAMEGNRELPSDVYRFIIRCTDTQGNLLFASHGDLWLRY